MKKEKEVKSRKTVLYIRVSTDFQAEEGYSIEAQEKKLRQWCELKNITNYEVYIDGGYSGSNFNRPEITKLVKEIEANLIECVVVYKLDRLSRSQKDTIFFLEDVLNPHNTSFISLNENFDTTTPYGKAMIGILSVFAQLERENIRERTRMGMAERVRRGLWMGGGRVPFGYDYNKSKGILVPNANAESVKEIFDLYLQGYSTTKLAKLYKFSGGDKMVANILDRETYTGKIIYNNEIIDGMHKAIIDNDTFEKVKEERRKRSKISMSNSEYLLSGLVRCGVCGAKMRYQKWGKSDLKIYCYSQQTTKTNLIKDENCDNHKIDGKELESIVLTNLFKKANKTEPINQTIDKRANILEVLQKQYDITAAKIKRLYSVYATSEDELLLEVIEETKVKLNDIFTKLTSEKTIKKIEKDIKEQHNIIENLQNMWGNMTNFERKQAIRSCIDKVIITHEEVEIKYLF